MITTNDIAGFIAVAIQNNKPGIILAMNNTGNFVPSNISDPDLAARVWDVFADQGIAGLKKVFDKVSVTSAITEEQARALVVRFKGADPNAKFGDLVNQVGTFFGDLLGGSSVTTGTVTNMSSESVLSPAMIGLIVVIGLILMVIFRKFIALVIGIIVIVLAVVLFGIFSKKITTTSTGGGTTSHGGIGQVVLTWLTGLGA